MKSQVKKKVSAGACLFLSAWFLIGIITGGCNGAQNAASLLNTNWQLHTYIFDSQIYDPVPGYPATLFFGSDRFDGHTGCNRFFGSYTLKKNYLTLKDIGTTEMACPDLMEQESRLLQLLTGTRTVQRNEEQLILSGEQGELHFRLVEGEAGQAPEAEGAGPSDLSQVAPVWRYEAVGQVFRGTFAYLADAAVFFDCDTRQRYGVVMASAFPDLEREYLEHLGDEAGRPVYTVVEGELRPKDPREEGHPYQLTVGKVISLNPDADCQMEILRFSGECTLRGHAAFFRDCATRKTFALAPDGAFPRLEQLYLELLELEAAPGREEAPLQPALVEAEGFILSGAAPEGDGAAEYLHLTMIHAIRVGEKCQ